MTLNIVDNPIEIVIVVFAVFILTAVAVWLGRKEGWFHRE